MRFILSLLGLIISCISYGQNNFSEIISKSEKAVCIITTYDKSGNSLKFGTGFFIDGNGTCVSNYHIFEDFAEALITTFNNKSYKISEIIKSSNVEDLILFKIKTDTISDFLKINNVIPKKGEKIIVIGNPQGLEWSASEGIISSVRQTEIGNILQITAPLSSGSSGSPVINTNGEVIGIATFLFNEGQSLNFALHIGILDSIKNVVSTLPLTNKTEEEFYSVIEQLEKERADELNLKNSKIYYSTDYAKELIDKYVNPFIEKHPNSYIGYTTKGRIVSLTPDFEDAFKEYSKAI